MKWAATSDDRDLQTIRKDYLDTLPELSHTNAMSNLRNVKVFPQTHADLRKLLKLRGQRYILDLVKILVDEDLKRQLAKK